MLRAARDFVFAVVLAGLASTAAAELHFERVEFRGRQVARVDAFVIILDASSSMQSGTFGQPKVEVAADLATVLVSSIPELPYRAGVRSFGQGNCLPDEDTSRLSDMRPFARTPLLAAVERVHCTNDHSPLDLALEAAATDLGTEQGRKAVIVLSDGLDMGGDEETAARRLHDATGTCIHVIQVGRHARGEVQLRRIVNAAGCGSFVNAENLTEPRNLTAWITRALLGQDADGDGVQDADDRCPNTPAGTEVDASGCPLDADGDGVPNGDDRCPNTPPRTPVDDSGCPVVEVTGETWSVPGEVLFTTGSSGLRPEARRVLDAVAGFLRRNPDQRLVVEGHTDDVGSDTYNQGLSERRADATRAYLVRQGVAGERLTLRGYGESQPRVPNDSAANRARNRRIEFRPLP